ncbi:hypothetical protein T492DRAFT_850507, partial [Pavlovales sp. CCMP2436]
MSAPDTSAPGGVPNGGDAGVPSAAPAAEYEGAHGDAGESNAPVRPRIPPPPLTHFFAPGGNKVFRLHETDVALVRPSGEVLLSSGGWVTSQTLRAINMALRACLPGIRVVSDGPVGNGAWKVTNGRGVTANFYDGIVLMGGTQADEMPQARGGGYGGRGGFGGGRGNGYGGRGGGGGNFGRGGRGAAGPPTKGAGRLSEAEVEHLFESDEATAAAAAEASGSEPVINFEKVACLLTLALALALAYCILAHLQPKPKPKPTPTPTPKPTPTLTPTPTPTATAQYAEMPV